jgi:hypothetical protein
LQHTAFYRSAWLNIKYNELEVSGAVWSKGDSTEMGSEIWSAYHRVGLQVTLEREEKASLLNLFE